MVLSRTQCGLDQNAGHFDKLCTSSTCSALCNNFPYLHRITPINRACLRRASWTKNVCPDQCVHISKNVRPHEIPYAPHYNPFMSQRHRIQNEKIMFITTNTFDQEDIFEDPAHAREAIEHLYRIRKKIPFFLYAFVIMTDHCHFLLKVRAPGKISNVMRAYKMGLTFQTGICYFWQPRFYQQFPEDPEAVLHYIHQNPVKAELCKRPKDYPWSSACGKWPVDALPTKCRNA